MVRSPRSSQAQLPKQLLEPRDVDGDRASSFGQDLGLPCFGTLSRRYTKAIAWPLAWRTT